MESVNPYNANKEWHTPDAVARQDSNSLFVPSHPPMSPSDEPEGSEEATSGVDYKKRYDDLKGYHDRKINELKQEMKQEIAKVASDKRNATEDLANTKAISEFETENPNTSEALRAIAGEENKGLREELEELKKSNDVARKREAKADLKRLHPDIDSILSDGVFHQWVDSQPESVQSWITQNQYDGVSAARAIDLYKQDKGITTPSADEVNASRQSQSSAADLVPTRPAGTSTPNEKKIWSRREIQAMSATAYEKWEQEIDLAVEEGRIQP